ncbi:MAG: TatD family hydrolase [Patescibacteria group bacterium]
MGFKYFDVHSHVFSKDFDEDRDAVLLRMAEQEVGTITVGVDIKTSLEAVSFAEKHPDFYATIGLHPTDTVTETFDEHLYEKMVSHPKVVGIGECGLDYFRLPPFAKASGGDPAAEKRRQRVEFEKQIAFAKKYNKPLMLHCRPSKGTMDAYEDALDILEPAVRRSGGNLKGNAHFFVGDIPIAKRFYELGFTTSYTGVLTFAREYDEVVRYAPLDLLLTETDSPYAAPTPHRGKRNEPSYVKHVVAAIARIRGADEEAVRSQIAENTRRAFAIS